MSSNLATSSITLKQRQKGDASSPKKSPADAPIPTISQGAWKQMWSERIPGSILSKLVIFSLLMLTIPIGSYFAAQKYLFSELKGGGGGEIYSAIIAVIAANLLLVAYVFVAIQEDQEHQKSSSFNSTHLVKTD